jgi:hypothetical protein
MWLIEPIREDIPKVEKKPRGKMPRKELPPELFNCSIDSSTEADSPLPTWQAEGRGEDGRVAGVES